MVELVAVVVVDTWVLVEVEVEVDDEDWAGEVLEDEELEATVPEELVSPGHAVNSRDLTSSRRACLSSAVHVSNVIKPQRNISYEEPELLADAEVVVVVWALEVVAVVVLLVTGTVVVLVEGTPDVVVVPVPGPTVAWFEVVVEVLDVVLEAADGVAVL